jgi:hypothetical protein
LACNNLALGPAECSVKIPQRLRGLNVQSFGFEKLIKAEKAPGLM